MSDEEYEVGYGKPPKKSQFKKGVSGNPNGRPKKKKSISDILEEELSQKVVVKNSGKQEILTKKELIVKVLVQKTMKGDINALKQVIALKDDDFSVCDFDPTDDDQAILEQLKEANGQK